MRQVRLIAIDMTSCLIWLLAVSCLTGSIKVSCDSGVVVRPNPTQNLSWWQTGVVYQIYPRSFKDSDGDGIGDIRGIISELDYFTYLGIDCIWLSPVCRSPMKDFGYDCSDFKDIDPVFGTLDDYKTLVAEAHKRGLKILSDFESVYSSDQHDWFQKSVRRQGKYTNYYVWEDGIVLPNGTRAPPNNWLSIFGGSAWQWNDERRQFYYHVFLKEQPDLNHRDANVRWEMLNVLRYWLDLGVDGFRLDAISALYETENVTLNEPPSGRNVPQDQEDFLNHTYTQNQPEVYPDVTSWHELLQEYSRKDGNERFMVIEIYEGTQIRNKLYATGGNPFNFDLLGMSRNLTAREVFATVMNEYDNLPPGKWPNFVLGNHDSRRISHLYGPQYVDVFNILVLTLWGTPTTYYGEELGMLEADLRWDQTLDPWGLFYGPSRYDEFSRDPERTPMQWSSGPQSGFTTGNTTWLPLATNYTTLNVQTEKESSQHTSLKLYKQLVALRKKQAFQTGDFKPAIVTDDVFSYFRVGDSETYLVVLNFREETVNDWSTYAGVKATPVLVTPGVNAIQEGQEVNLQNLRLGPGQGLVLRVSTTTSPIIG